MSKKKIVADVAEEVVKEPIIISRGMPVTIPKTEKELLVECYEFMKSRAINSISDIENKIARA